MKETLCQLRINTTPYNDQTNRTETALVEIKDEKNTLDYHRTR